MSRVSLMRAFCARSTLTAGSTQTFKTSATMTSAINAAASTLSENLGGVAQKIAPSHTKFSTDDVPDQSGKVAVITGGSEGIGYGVSFALLSKNINRVFILSTSKEVVDKARDAVRRELGDDKADKTSWIQCDLAAWDKIPSIAEQIKNSTDRIDILVNNAGRGIMTAEHTDYGVDKHMALNHFGHVLLTSHLLPLLKKTASNGNVVRISNQASNAHESAPKETSFADQNELNKDYGPLAQYGRSKLANILYTKYLARHVTKNSPRILANATHPGVVSTKMSKDDIHEPYPLAGYGMSLVLEQFKKDQFDGALSTLYAVTKTENSGEYICPPAAVEAGSELARSEELGEQLMKLTSRVIKEKTGQEAPAFH
ncbi:hypothetical protein AC579_825 [Pseudocercospora musae]|uniref:Oxidoreductase bli-4, mitochondrial n=1 Tax=Pseudocercospora musae TaxID=113226 RepID=A0A139GT89_9PEZI|nr:hypothetical protein AC579_825 [Pseudocercospora musae]